MENINKKPESGYQEVSRLVAQKMKVNIAKARQSVQCVLSSIVDLATKEKNVTVKKTVLSIKNFGSFIVLPPRDKVRTFPGHAAKPIAKKRIRFKLSNTFKKSLNG